MKRKSMLSKVPEVTLYFWIIKILCTTVGETASDFLNVSLGLGLNGTSVVMGFLLLAALVFQVKAQKYIPGIYWLTVVLISIFGTLVTDNFTDKMGIPLEASTIVFSVALALTFAVWFAYEKTLSIHSIFTLRRELFYWSAILFTFALGTASGDLMAESLGLGYLVTGIIVCAVVVAAIIAWHLGLDPVLSFWIAYIMTRPLGASLGDWLSQAHANGGLGLGATNTSALFISAILLTVLFLSVTKRDLIAKTLSNDLPGKQPKGVFLQTAVVIGVLVIAAGLGYQWRHAKLQIAAPGTAAAAIMPLGDLSEFRIIAENSLTMVKSGDIPGARNRIKDLEKSWDFSEPGLRPKNPQIWTVVDKSIDRVLTQLRSHAPDSAACCLALGGFIAQCRGLCK
ncbi:MAG: hypothetical protein PHC61_02950 [Chitinivibrionales bacterium]|nr:hypothetical protein [Chitinivibrionales bacterium]